MTNCLNSSSLLPFPLFEEQEIINQKRMDLLSFRGANKPSELAGSEPKLLRVGDGASGKEAAKVSCSIEGCEVW